MKDPNDFYTIDMFGYDSKSFEQTEKVTVLRDVSMREVSLCYDYENDSVGFAPSFYTKPVDTMPTIEKRADKARFTDFSSCFDAATSFPSDELKAKVKQNPTLWHF